MLTNMKKILTPLALLCICFSLQAQKVDLDKFSFDFNYRNLPHKPLDAAFKTYTIEVTSSPSVRNAFIDEEAEDMITLEGWKKLSTSEKGHVEIKIILNDINIVSSQVSERIEIVKDKEGKETGRKNFYKMIVVYRWKGRVIMSDYKKKTLENISVGPINNQKWDSEEFNTSEDATEYYTNNLDLIKGELIRKEVTSALRMANENINFNYGYPESKESETLWILATKKHPESATQKKYSDFFKSTISDVTVEELSPQTKEKLNEIIAYFDGIPNRFATEDKGDKKLRYASYFNKAKIYLYLDNPESAIEEADKLISNGYDDVDGKRIKKEAEELIELFNANNISSRHFVIDTSSATPPLDN